MSAGKARLGSGAEPSGASDRTAFASLFDDHAAHLYDYCLSLLGDEAEATGAARVTLIAAYMLGARITEPDRLRAWMFALARRECLSDAPTRREPWAGPAGRAEDETAADAIAEAETNEFPRIGFEAELRRVVQLRPLRGPRTDQFREAADIVERHGIPADELPAILDVPAEDAEELLSARPDWAEFLVRADPVPSPPASLWRDTAGAVFDPEQIEYCHAIAADAGRLWTDGFPADPADPAVLPPSHGKMAMTSVGLAAALLAPAALGAGLYAAFAASPHSATRSHDYSIGGPVGTAPPSPSASSPGRRHGQRHQQTPASVPPVLPTTPVSAPGQPGPHSSSPTTSPTQHATSPPVITSGPPTSTTTPTPSPTGSSPSPTPAPTSTTPSPPPSALPTNGATGSSPGPGSSSPSPPPSGSSTTG